MCNEIIRRVWLWIGGLSLAFLIMTGISGAQERATIQATATVVSSLTVIGTNNLQFGTVTPGTNKSVDKSTVGFAGEWSITGTSSAELDIQWVLPDSLKTADSLSAMRINFNSTDASYSTGAGTQSSPNGIFNPNGPVVQRLGAGGAMTIWIGGTVFPRISQTGGDYAADVMLIVAYTGS